MIYGLAPLWARRSAMSGTWDERMVTALIMLFAIVVVLVSL